MDQPQDPNAITPSTPEQVQVVNQPEAPAQPEAGQTPAPDATPAPEPTPDTPAPTAEQPIGYDAYTDDDFRQGYEDLCNKTGRQFGIRHELVIENGVTDTTKFKNVLVVAKQG